jgi:hypothetical protein
MVRISITCGLVFGAVALLPPVAAAQFAEKKVLGAQLTRRRALTHNGLSVLAGKVN